MSAIERLWKFACAQITNIKIPFEEKKKLKINKFDIFV